MADPVTLLSILTTGATVVAQATIEEATREAWQGMKAVVQDVFGRRTSGSLAKLEAVETRPEGLSELSQLLGPIGGPDAAAVVVATERLMEALRNDPGAQEVMVRNEINLDLDVGGDVLLQRIQGVHGINVRSKSEGDFTLSDVTMGRALPRETERRVVPGGQRAATIKHPNFGADHRRRYVRWNGVRRDAGIDKFFLYRIGRRSVHAASPDDGDATR